MVFKRLVDTTEKGYFPQKKTRLGVN